MTTLRQHLLAELETLKSWCQNKHYRTQPLAELLRDTAHSAGDEPLMTFLQETADEGDSDPRWSPLFDVEQWPPLEKGPLLGDVERTTTALRKLKELKVLIGMLQNLPKREKDLLSSFYKVSV